MPISNIAAGITLFQALTLNGVANERTPPISGGKITINPDDNFIYINNQTSAAISIDLSNHNTKFQLLFIKDIAGNAGTFAITVSATIDGINNPVFQSNYAGAVLSWNGSFFSEHA